MNRPGGPAAGMIPVGNIHFTSPTHSAFIPPLSLGDQQWCSLPTASSVVGKHEVTQETQATSDPAPLLCIYGNGHLTNPARAWCICSDNVFCSPECRAHGLQRGGVASYDRETARRWPAPAHHFVTNHNFGWRRQPPGHGGKWKSKSAAATERDIQTSSQCLSRSGVGVRPPDMSPAPVCLVWPVV